MVILMMVIEDCADSNAQGVRRRQTEVPQTRKGGARLSKGWQRSFLSPFKQILTLNTHDLQTAFGTERFSVMGQLSL